MQAIGIDIGTTSICGVAMDTNSGKVIKSVTKNSDAFIRTEYDWERIQDANKIISLALSVLDEVLTEDTVCIGVTGQMHGIVYFDSDGAPVSPLYTWQDGRGNLPYKDSTYAKELSGASGFGCVTDLYNRVNGLVPKNAVGFCTIHDLFVMYLCNLTTPIMHASDAASLGCFDIHSGKFTNGLEINVTDGFTIAGLHKDIPVSVAIGDNQASVFSCIREGELLLNFGTGSQISYISDTVGEGSEMETRPFLGGKYLHVGAALCGGRAFSILKDFFKSVLSYKNPDITDGEVYGIMDRMLEKVKEPIPTADTRFDGTRKDTSITGSISGITPEGFTPEGFTAAILKGMVDELYRMLPTSAPHFSGLVGSGNGIRKNPPLVKMCEERLGMTLKIPAHPEEAAYGAAMFALVAGGKKTVDEVQSLIKYIK